MAEALYRKYRPQTFNDVVGQTHIERTLKNAIESDKVSHAYLFCGPRGTGKTTTARILAKALLCESGPTPQPDDTCEQCRQITLGIHPDVNEMDAASRTGVENVREEIIGRVQFAPTFGRRKIYIIDEVHMLTVPAFNALLKTLEEPPAHVVFIMCTTDPQKIPETILSRCQRFDFHRLTEPEIVSRLEQVCQAEQVGYDPGALQMVAARAQGGMRDALTSLEQVIAFGNGEASLDAAKLALGVSSSEELDTLVECLARRDAGGAFGWLEQLVQNGTDLAQFAKGLTMRVRDLYVLQVTGGQVAISASADELEGLRNQAKGFGPDRLAFLLDELGKMGTELKTSSNPRMTFELFLVRATRPETDLTLESLAARVEVLEQALASGSFAAAPAAAVTPAAAVAPAAAPAPAPAPRPAVSAPAAVPAPRPAAAAPAVPAVVRPVAQAPAAPAVQVASTPAAQASAVPSAGAASGVAAKIANPISLQRHWQAALKLLKGKKAAWGSLLMSAQIAPDQSASGVLLQYPEENDFAYNIAQGAEVQAALAECLRDAFGEDVPFRVVKAQPASGSGAAAAAIAAASAARSFGSSAGSAAQVSRKKPGQGFDAAAVVAATKDVVTNAPVAKPKFVQRGKQVPVTPDTQPPQEDVVPYSDADAAGYGYEDFGSIPPWEDLPAAVPMAAPVPAPAPVAVPAPAPAPAPAPVAAPAPAPAPVPSESKFVVPEVNPFSVSAPAARSVARKPATHTSVMPDGPEPVDPYPVGLELGFDSMPDPKNAKGTVEPEGWPGVGQEPEPTAAQAQVAQDFMKFKAQAMEAAESSKADAAAQDQTPQSSEPAGPEMAMEDIFGAFGVNMSEVSEY